RPLCRKGLGIATLRPFPVGPVAQWSELAAHNRLVGGSSPPGPTSLHLRGDPAHQPATGTDQDAKPGREAARRIVHQGVHHGAALLTGPPFHLVERRPRRMICMIEHRRLLRLCLRHAAAVMRSATAWMRGVAAAAMCSAINPL